MTLTGDTEESASSVIRDSENLSTPKGQTEYSR